MNCDFQRIEALFDGTLSDQESAEVRQHLSVCPTCCRWYEALEGLHRPETAPADLLDRVMDEVAAHPRKKNRRWVRTVASLAACAVLVVLVGFGSLGDTIAPGEGGQTRDADPDPAAYSVEEGESTDMDRWLAGIESGGIADQGRWHLAGELHDLPLGSDETEAARLWLERSGLTATEGEHGSAYCLAAEDAVALNAAVPSLGLPTDGEVQLYLPAE